MSTTPEFLSEGGLTYYHGKITKVINDGLATKVTAVEGKGLSPEEYTNAEKTKLASFAAEDQYARKADLSSVYRFKASVDTVDDLPTEDQVVGDVYDVKADGMNYAWDGAKWDALGSAIAISAIPNSTIDGLFTSETDETSGS